MTGIEVTSITLTDGSVIPSEKAGCPACQSLDLGLDCVRTAEPFGGWLLTCTAGHQWVLQPVGEDDWVVLLDMGGGIFAGTYDSPHA